MSHDCSISAEHQTSKETCGNKVTSDNIIQTRNLDTSKSHIYMQWKNSNAKHGRVEKHELIYLPTAFFHFGFLTEEISSAERRIHL